MPARWNGVMVRGIQVAVIALVLVAWQIAGSRGTVPELLLPPLGKVVARLGQILSDPGAYFHIRVTLVEFGAAMALSLATGLAVGAMTGTIRYLGELLEPLIVAFYAVPIIMVYPLCILFFGVGASSKIAFAGIYCFFPIAIQTMKGIRNVDRALVRAARSMGANRWQLISKVMVPAAFPMVVTGLRLAAVLSLLSVVAGEMIASVHGVGAQITATRGNFDSVGLYAWILIVIGLVTVISGILAWADGRFTGGE